MEWSFLKPDWNLKAMIQPVSQSTSQPVSQSGSSTNRSEPEQKLIVGGNMLMLARLTPSNTEGVSLASIYG